MRIASASMYPTLPEDSLLIIQMVDPSELSVDDVITYINANQVVVTHRIIDIEENDGTGMRTFRLQGDANQAPDRNVATPDHVLGRVIWNNHHLGRVLFFFQQHALLILIVMLMVKAFSYQRNKKIEGK